MGGSSTTATTIALTVTMGVSALLTSGVSALGPALREDLMLSRAELSFVPLVVFATASATSILWGFLSDHLKPWLGIFLTFFMAILGLTGAVLSQSLAVLLVSAVAGGCSLAISSTVTSKLVSRFVDPRRQGRVLSTKQMGVQFAQVIAGLLFPMVAVVSSWRIGLASGIVVTVIAGILIYLTARHHFVEPVETMEVLKNGAVSTRPDSALLLIMILYALGTGICFQANLFGLPLIGYEQLGLDVAIASRVVVVLGAVGFISRLGWGMLADRPFNIRTVMLVLGAGLILGELAVLTAIGTGLTWSFWVGAVLVGTFFALVPVVLSAIVLKYFSHNRIGLVSGFISVSTFGGFAAGPLLFGVVADTWGYMHSSVILVGTALVAGLVPWLIPRRRTNSQTVEIEENKHLIRKDT